MSVVSLKKVQRKTTILLLLIACSYGFSGCGVLFVSHTYKNSGYSQPICMKRQCIHAEQRRLALKRAARKNKRKEQKADPRTPVAHHKHDVIAASHSKSKDDTATFNSVVRNTTKEENSLAAKKDSMEITPKKETKSPLEKELVYFNGKEINLNQTYILNNVTFQSGKAHLSASAMKELGDLLILLKKNEDWKIYIGGHTDNIGDFDSNVTLSEKRAQAVRHFLVKKGVNDQRIYATGFGSNIPCRPNNTTENREKNRRVEFKVVPIQ